MKKFKIGLQLYSVRDDMKADMRKTLQEVKDMGYDCVEFAGYFGKTAEEIRAMLDEIGLECVSVHQTHGVFIENFEENAKFLKTLGAKYSGIPWMNKDEIVTEKFISDVKTVGEKLKNEGITLVYHNHEFEFEKTGDQFILDWLYSSVDASLLQTQLDTCWVKYGGQDPVEYLKKYAGRAPIVHLKDFVCDNFASGPVYALIDENGVADNKPKTRDENGFKFMPVGYGMQDFPSIIKAAEEAGADIFIVEQDQSPDRPALESARMSREYLKTLGL